MQLSTAEAELIFLESCIHKSKGYDCPLDTGIKNMEGSSAKGIWQGLKNTRISYGKLIGVDPETTDYRDQVAMMRRYVEKRYTTPEKALAFWKNNQAVEGKGWY